MASPVVIHSSQQTGDIEDAGSSESYDTDHDVFATSTHSYGGSAIVTLPPEEVLRLTTSQDENEQFDSSQHQNNNNNGNNHRVIHQTTAHTESTSSQPTSVTLPTEQVLSLTMDDDSSHSSGLDSVDDHQTESRAAKEKKKAKGEKSTSSRNTPSRTKSGSGRSGRSTPLRTKSGSSRSGRSTPLRTKSSSSRDTPSRTTSSSSKDKKEIRRAMRKEKKSVDAVVAAAIRNYGADEKAESPRKSSKKKKSSPKSSARKSSPRGEDASMATGTGSAKKRKKKSVRQKPSPDELPPDSGENQAPAAPIEETPLPPPLNEQISCSSFCSIDRAGAIAVFPSDSIHATQRRSITDHQGISDNDYSRSNLLTIDDEAPIQRGSVSRAVHRLEELDSTTRTYEEIPEPPESQVINATATYQSQQTPTMPPPMGSRSRTPYSALSRGDINNPGDALSSVTMPLSSQDSSADDGFLGGSLITDAESGTVTAKAISSEDYYSEVRRQLEQEAVIAVDVIPLNAEGRPLEAGTNRRNRDRGGPSKHSKAKRSRLTTPNYILLGVGIGLLAILVVLFLIFNAKIGDTSPSIGAPQMPNDTIDGVPDIADNNIENNSSNENIIDQNEITSNPIIADDDMAQMMELMSSETASFWRRQFANILPPETLVDIVSDKMYMTPVGKAFVFLVENVESLFIIDNMRDYSLTPDEESLASTIFALVTIYHTLDGPNWFVGGNWLDADVYICEWHGVNCQGEMLPKATIAETQVKDQRGEITSERGGGTNQQDRQDFAEFVPLPPEDVYDPIITSGDDNFDTDIFIDGADDFGALEDHEEDPQYEVPDKIHDYFSDKLAIHSLDLKANGLAGTFPRELGMLSNIYDTIDLSVNEITGSIPTRLGTLSKLQNILLQQNKIESSLPTELGSMSCIKTFDISGNFEINGTFPHTLDQWKGIERLEIQNTNIEGIVSENFCEMVYERTSPLNELFYISRYEWDGTFSFKASCPSPLACPCCTQCCHQDINGNDKCGPILEFTYLEDD